MLIHKHGINYFEKELGKFLIDDDGEPLFKGNDKSLKELSNLTIELGKILEDSFKHYQEEENKIQEFKRLLGEKFSEHAQDNIQNLESVEAFDKEILEKTKNLIDSVSALQHVISEYNRVNTKDFGRENVEAYVSGIMKQCASSIKSTVDSLALYKLNCQNLAHQIRSVIDEENAYLEFKNNIKTSNEVFLNNITSWL